MEKGTENTRVTLIGIIVEDPEAAIRINGLLHEYGCLLYTSDAADE